MIYEIVETFTGSMIMATSEGDGMIFWIPLDPANADYQQYLLWLEEQA